MNRSADNGASPSGMVSRGKSRQRIEPSFEGDRDRDDEMRLEAGDRIAGGGSRSRSGGTATKVKREPSGRRRKSNSRSGPLVFLRRMTYWCVVLGLWCGIGVTGLVVYYASRMPSASTWAVPQRPANVKITAMDGTVLANRGGTGGEALSLEEMSPYIPQALIAIEDRRFYSHFGVDPQGLARAFATNLVSGRMLQGGSTLTQQLAKNLFLSAERTLERKVQELLLSFWLEHKFTKDQILAMYLNRVFFGSNAYGVEAASRRYFNKSARDVNLGEAALLAGLLKAPTRLSPARDPAAAEERAQVVLAAMREQDFITDSEITTAMSQAPTKAKSYWSGAEHYAADMVMEDVRTLLGNVTNDIVVDTTIDRTMEQNAEKTLTHILKGEGVKLNASQAALVSIDGTGAIRAIVGGADYAQSQFNRAVKAKRQPGSAFKPFVYAGALEMGLSPDTIRNDAPVRIGNWTPENYDEKYRGEVTLSRALAESLNTIAAQLVLEVGADRVVKIAHRLGIESELQTNASIALGTSEVSLLELTAAYAPFMNGGFKATPHIIRRISTPDGEVLYENKYDNPPHVIGEGVAATLNRMLMQVMTEGTGKNARLDAWPAAGKSGTTQSFRDALFVGYTANLTTGVWFGNDDGKSMKKVTGGGLPAKAWKEFMTKAHAGLSPAPLFGTASTEEMPLELPQQPPASGDNIVSGGWAAEGTGFPSAPASGEKTGSVAPAGAPDGVLVPPVDISRGETAGQPKKTTLFDIIMGN